VVLPRALSVRAGWVMPMWSEPAELLVIRMSDSELP